MRKPARSSKRLGSSRKLSSTRSREEDAGRRMSGSIAFFERKYKTASCFRNRIVSNYSAALFAISVEPSLERRRSLFQKAGAFLKLLNSGSSVARCQTFRDNCSIDIAGQKMREAIFALAKCAVDLLDQRRPEADQHVEFATQVGGLGWIRHTFSASEQFVDCLRSAEQKQADQRALVVRQREFLRRQVFVMLDARGELLGSQHLHLQDTQRPDDVEDLKSRERLVRRLLIGGCNQRIQRHRINVRRQFLLFDHAAPSTRASAGMEWESSVSVI